MFLKIASSGIGGVAVVGTGLGIYLTKNSENDTNNPPHKNLQKVEQILLQIQNI